MSEPNDEKDDLTQEEIDALVEGDTDTEDDDDPEDIEPEDNIDSPEEKS